MKNLVLLIALSLIVSSCAMTGAFSKNGGGWLQFHKDSGMVTSNAVGKKRGKACAHNLLGVTWGDASIEKARRTGRITKISYVDDKYTNILFLYGKHCTYVRGM